MGFQMKIHEGMKNPLNIGELKSPYGFSVLCQTLTVERTTTENKCSQLKCLIF